MNKPLSRRNALKAFAAAPVSLKAVTAKVAEIAAAGAAANLGLYAATAPMPEAYGLWRVVQNDTMAALHATGMLPQWVRDEVEENAKISRHGVSVNLAALRSVSLAAKLTIAQQRAIENTWASYPAARARFLASRAFNQSQGVGQTGQIIG